MWDTSLEQFIQVANIFAIENVPMLIWRTDPYFYLFYLFFDGYPIQLTKGTRRTLRVKSERKITFVLSRSVEQLLRELHAVKKI